MADIVQLKDDNGNDIYPISSANATYLDDGTRLVDHCLTVDDVTVLDGTVPIDADKLGGELPSAFMRSNAIKYETRTVPFTNGTATINFDRNVYILNMYPVLTTNVMTFARVNQFYSYLITCKDAITGDVYIDILYMEIS